MGARFLRWIFNILCAILTRREVEGWENVPAEGPYILAANHLSIIDLPLLFGLIGAENVTGWAAEKWENHAIVGRLLRLGGGIFIQRGEVDRGAIQSAIHWLKAGNIFGIAPEGTRSHTATLMRAKTGVAFLADATGAPILPVAMRGNESTFAELMRLRRPKLHVHFGKPFHLPPLDPENRVASLRRNTDEVMCHIALLLPESYRGVYADHPILEQLREESRS